ncbi:hypothetical protein Pla110_10510 [Polystyrenella longa]|uniref:Uncharacterized protein n=1 Tax=Polystyrenella longa TaxID=2528007 RepID=A0A518CJD9_9PLAN|nr:hypothetical protein Pla110_10510 [Polystyrenella longa]
MPDTVSVKGPGTGHRSDEGILIQSRENLLDLVSRSGKIDVRQVVTVVDVGVIFEAQ